MLTDIHFNNKRKYYSINSSYVEQNERERS